MRSWIRSSPDPDAVASQDDQLHQPVTVELPGGEPGTARDLGQALHLLAVGGEEPEGSVGEKREMRLAYLPGRVAYLRQVVQIVDINIGVLPLLFYVWRD